MTITALNSIQQPAGMIHLTTDLYFIHGFTRHQKPSPALSFSQQRRPFACKRASLQIFPKLAGRALNSPFHVCEFCTSIMIYDQYSKFPRLITGRRRLLVDLASASSEITV